MKTVTLCIDDGIVEKFLWLIKNFKNEIKKNIGSVRVCQR
jgi:hypothetical protein